MNRQLTIGLAALLVALLGAGVALAQGGPEVNWWVVAGGGAPSSAAGVTLNDTLGQPVIGAASSGDLALRDGYWVACVAAPAAVPVVAVSRDGADIVLTWPADPANTQYQVWVSTNPYFDPNSQPPTAVTANTTYPDPGAAASLENHYYIVRGINACGAPSANSARKGEFTFGLTPGN